LREIFPAQFVGFVIKTFTSAQSLQKPKLSEKAKYKTTPKNEELIVPDEEFIEIISCE